MGVGDLGNAAQLARPGNLLEEAIRVRDVRLDLAALGVVEIALADHQELQLVVLEQRTRRHRRSRRYVRAIDRLRARRSCPPAAPSARSPATIDVEDSARARRDALARSRRAARRSRRSRRGPRVEQQLGALRARSSRSAACIEIRESMADDLEILRVELLLLHQHLLAHADFAEVVQQAGVAQLAELFAREADVAIRPSPPRSTASARPTVSVATRHE